MQGDRGDKGDRGLTTTFKGDLPTGIIEGPPGPPGPAGKFNCNIIIIICDVRWVRLWLRPVSAHVETFHFDCSLYCYRFTILINSDAH